MKRTRHRCQAFVLVLVLAVLALLAGVVAAAALQIRTGAARAEAEVNRALARRHALLGLSLALANLQAAAGPDARAVARAELLANPDPNKAAWTGVWEQAGSPRWLVSGTAPDPLARCSVDAVEMVGGASADVTGAPESDPDRVRVEAVPLTIPADALPGWGAPEPPVIGRYAYWVGEENGKIPAFIRDVRRAEEGLPAATPWVQPDLAALWGGTDPGAGATESWTARVLTLDQLGFVDAVAYSPSRLRRTFHRVSVQSAAVAANPLDGGLRRAGTAGEDRTALYGSVPAPRYDAAIAFVPPRAADGVSLLPAARAAYPPTPAPIQALTPLPVRFLIAGAFNVNHVSADPAVQRERWRAMLAAAPRIPLPTGARRELSPAELDALARELTAARFRAAYPDVRKLAFAPFAGIDAWVRSGLLAAAIDAAGLNLGRQPDDPDYLTASALVDGLAPILVARSDTFRVRAYGQTRDPRTGQTQGEAWCEAVVQRVPTYVDPADAPDRAPTQQLNRNLGRRFERVSFRWLTPADL